MNTDIYKEIKSIDAQSALNELAKYILGDNFSIPDPLSTKQCNWIILNLIKEKIDKNGN